jgi:hypothetical protein
MFDTVFTLFIYFSHVYLMNSIHQKAIHELLDPLIIILPEWYDCVESNPVSNFRNRAERLAWKQAILTDRLKLRWPKNNTENDRKWGTDEAVTGPGR